MVFYSLNSNVNVFLRDRAEEKMNILVPGYLSITMLWLRSYFDLTFLNCFHDTLLY